jgi:hypothetical protein
MLRFLTLSLAAAMALAAVGPAAAAGFVKIGTYSFNGDGELVGARLTALGGADIAGEQGPEVVLANPAPLGFGTGAVAAYSSLAQYLPWEDDVALESVAVAGGWETLRVSFCRVGYGKDDALLRTAYDPEGSLSSYHRSMTVLGVSWEAARRWLGGTPWRLAVGVNQRHYRFDNYGRVTSADSWDVGATLGWEKRRRGTGLAVRGAWSKQNVAGKGLRYYPQLPELPLQQPWRAGLTVRGHLDWPGMSRELVALLVAYTHLEETVRYYMDADQYGVELTLGGVLALRYGQDNDTVSAPESWGLGLVLDEGFMGPVHARVHWARLWYDGDWLEDTDLWGAELGVRF